MDRSYAWRALSLDIDSWWFRHGTWDFTCHMRFSELSPQLYGWLDWHPLPWRWSQQDPPRFRTFLGFISWGRYTLQCCKVVPPTKLPCDQLNLWFTLTAIAYRTVTNWNVYIHIIYIYIYIHIYFDWGPNNFSRNCKLDNEEDVWPKIRWISLNTTELN